jgi:hypothetical protein
VYPELVIRDAVGAIQGVHYEELAPMLLNELQRQQKDLAIEDARLAAQARELAALKRELAGLKGASHASGM